MRTIAGGQEHSLFVDVDGFVWGCGNSEHGQLGFEEHTQLFSPVKIKQLQSIISVAAGQYYSLFLDSSGNVYSCGENKYGQLGVGDLIPRRIPVKISLPKIKAISCLYAHSLFLDYEGSVWSCGNNGSGELGLTDQAQRNKPVRIQSVPKITAASCGGNHSIFLDEFGFVWVCGTNTYGQLGLGDQIQRNQPVKITTLSKVISISAGFYHSLFLVEGGVVWCSGNNSQGQLGVGDTIQRTHPVKIPDLPPIKMTCAGGNHSAFLAEDGAVYTCGYNVNGQLGHNDTKLRNQPTKMKAEPAKNIACGYHYTITVDMNGSCYSCGKNIHGQLGLGKDENNSSFLKLSYVDLAVRVKDASQIIGKTAELRDIFADLQKQRDIHLIDKITLSTVRRDMKDYQFLRQNMLNGNIPMFDWPTIWEAYSTRFAELQEIEREAKCDLEEKKKLMLEVQQAIVKREEQLVNLEQEKVVVTFFKDFLAPVAAQEKALSESFMEKKDPKGFTVDDVSLFLNKCSLPELVALFQEKQIDGQQLILYSCTDAFSEVGIEDILHVTALKFYCRILESGLFLDQAKLDQTNVWRHLAPNKTVSLLNEFEIRLNSNIVLERQISVGQLLFFSVRDLMDVFALPLHEAAEAKSKIFMLLKDFKGFLKESRLQM